MKHTSAWTMAIVLLLLAALLIGCAPTLSTGTVTQKAHNEQRTTLVWQMQRIGNTTFMQAMPIHHPESWQIEVASTESDYREWWYVDFGVFVGVQVGDAVYRDTEGTIHIAHPPD